MQFRLTEDQRELQDTVRRFCAETLPIDRIADRPADFDRDSYWRSLADLGVFGLLVTEERGGTGLGCVEATVVFEQLGAHLAGGPILWSTMTAPHLQGIADCAQVVAGVEGPPITTDPILVDHGAVADLVVVLRDECAYVVERDQLPEPVPVDPLDPLTPVSWFPSLPPGSPLGDERCFQRLQLLGTVLSSALLLGVASQALEVARRYALGREQFNVPIGSFQALKHLMADMFVRVELARSATYAGAVMIDNPQTGDPQREAGRAKLLAGEAAAANARAAIQILGGMGFTWAMPPHFLLKRAWILENSFGTAEAHARALGSRFDGEVT